MKQIVYTFHPRGSYLPDQPAKFGTESHLKLVVEPHNYELKISNEVISRSSCNGYIIQVSRNGEVCFYDYENQLISWAKPTEKEYVQVNLMWKQETLRLCFGRERTVDYYPNCDGEYDRWGTEWVTEYEVSLHTMTNLLETE